MITLNDIKDAKKRLDGTVYKTPLMKAPFLSTEKNAEIFFKEDNLQLTGSFKLRGAFNKVAMLDDVKKAAGVVAASAGNHAQGLAFAASYFKCEATIFMPEATPLTKVLGVKSYGANVVLTGENFDEAYASAIKFAKDNNKEFVHPFADDEVIAGQGTIALEILEKIEDIDQIIVPIGGGGLISGIAIAAKSINPNIKITGVVASGAKGMKESFEARMPIDSSSVRTIADGIAVRDVNPKLLDIILEYVDEIVEVSDNETANAILFLLEKHKLMVEGAGAVSVAAIMHDKINIENKKVCAVVSGGNIDVLTISSMINKGLVTRGRIFTFSVQLPDKPGQLLKVSETLSSLNANVIKLDHNQFKNLDRFHEVELQVTVETNGEDHIKMITETFANEGYKVIRLNTSGI